MSEGCCCRYLMLTGSEDGQEGFSEDVTWMEGGIAVI